MASRGSEVLIHAACITCCCLVLFCSLTTLLQIIRDDSATSTISFADLEVQIKICAAMLTLFLASLNYLFFRQSPCVAGLTAISTTFVAAYIVENIRKQAWLTAILTIGVLPLSIGAWRYLNSAFLRTYVLDPEAPTCPSMRQRTERPSGGPLVVRHEIGRSH